MGLASTAWQEDSNLLPVMEHFAAFSEQFAV